MNRAGEPFDRHGLGSEYASALREYVDGAGEAALARAYELGRTAAVAGLGVLDMVAMHKAALEALPAGAKEARITGLATQFLSESLSPFEMTLRAYQQNVRLLGLSETLARQNEEIDRAREQLRSILDATTAVIYLTDTDGRYLFVNRQFERVFGLPRQDVIGRRVEDVVQDGVATASPEHSRQILEQGAPQEIEETIMHEDGPHTYLSLKVPLAGSSGAPHAICCVATDITERKHAAERLRRAKEAAESANRELEAFSYSVAHDLRAPLRSIDGFSEMVLRNAGERLDEQSGRHLHQVRESVQYMRRLIEGLLALSRVSRAELHYRRVDLSALARRVLQRLAAREPERRVEVTVAEGISGYGDALLLEAMLENLLGNAWKFTSRRPAASIEFGVETGEGPRTYIVRDNGAGFDMARAGKLFGPFQRLHALSEFDGTGIGLATVQRIVRRHGGRIWAEAEVDRGATFRFTLEPEPPPDTDEAIPRRDR